MINERTDGVGLDPYASETEGDTNGIAVITVIVAITVITAVIALVDVFRAIKQ